MPSCQGSGETGVRHRALSSVTVLPPTHSQSITEQYKAAYMPQHSSASSSPCCCPKTAYTSTLKPMKVYSTSHHFERRPKCADNADCKFWRGSTVTLQLLRMCIQRVLLVRQPQEDKRIGSRCQQHFMHLYWRLHPWDCRGLHLLQLYQQPPPERRDEHKRIGKATTALALLEKRVWDNSMLTTNAKIQVYGACLLSTLLYCSEAWTLYSIKSGGSTTFTCILFQRLAKWLKQRISRYK